MLCHILGPTKWAMHVSTICMGKGTIVDTMVEYCVAFGWATNINSKDSVIRSIQIRDILFGMVNEMSDCPIHPVLHRYTFFRLQRVLLLVHRHIL